MDEAEEFVGGALCKAWSWYGEGRLDEAEALFNDPEETLASQAEQDRKIAAFVF
eukprot:SAG31_NODE_2325_length_5939_cov_5.827940_5_plen_54_part_00